jgi:hypothetical protein
MSQMIVDGARDDKGSKDNDVNQAAIVILCMYPMEEARHVWLM